MLSDEEKRIVGQENLFHDMPLCKLPSLKLLVDNVGVEGSDRLESLQRLAEKAMKEAMSFDLETESRYVWPLILRVLKLVCKIRGEAFAAIGVVEDDSDEDNDLINWEEVRHD